jgi:hypothetical protein
MASGATGIIVGCREDGSSDLVEERKVRGIELSADIREGALLKQVSAFRPHAQLLLPKVIVIVPRRNLPRAAPLNMR